MRRVGLTLGTDGTGSLVAAELIEHKEIDITLCVEW